MMKTSPASPKADILIVDDTPDNLRLLNQILSKYYKVRLAPSANIGLTAARSAPPDLILLDVMMPEINGYEVAAQLKSEKQTQEIPIIFISALNDIENKVRGFSAGGVDFVTKPFQEEEVLARVKTHLMLRSLYKQAQAEIVEGKIGLESERKRADEKNAQLAAIVEYSDDAILSQTLQGVVFSWNRGAERIYGYTEEEISGKESSLLVAPGHEGEMLKILTKIGLGTSVEHYETEHRRKDGQVIAMSLTASPIRDQEGNIIAASLIGRDITQSKQAEKNAIYRQQLLEKVIQLGKNVTQITDLKLCLHEIYRSVKYELGFDRVGLFLYDSATNMIHGVRGTSRQGMPEDTSWFSEEGSQKSAWHKALHTPSGIVVDDYQTTFNPPETNEMYDVKQYITLAAWAGDKPVAVISADNVISQREMNPADLEALQLFAGYAGLAIENARMNAELERRVEERTAEVRQNEAIYRALFENSNDGIFLYAPNGEELQANPQALKMLGYTLEEYQSVVAANPRRSLTSAEQSESEPRFQAVLRGEQTPLYERNFMAKDGKRVDVEVNLSAVRDASGRIVLVQSVMRDITERKKAEAVLRESRDKLSAANAALENASRMKDEFLASMSHELRTPLTGILGLSETLQLQTYGVLNVRQLKAVKNIESSGRHLLELINDILDLSKIEAGKLDMQFAPCAVADICQASLQLVKGMASQKKQSVGFSMNPVSIMVHADARRLKQILVNLLSNAVKFTPSGGQLGLEVAANEAEKAIAFCVWDKGIGIAPENLGKLFKPFVQLDSSLARQYSGTGLGLSLVQRMAEMHGGSVTVESKPGEGSRFTVFLPWSAATSQSAPELPLQNPNVLKNALIIEDNVLDAENITRYLKELGMTNIVQPTINGALEKAAAMQPSAILLDLHLPDGSGMDLLSQFKTDARTREIPVIITSVEERRREAAKLGALGYLVKPFTLQELHTELSKAAALNQPNNPVMVIGENASAALVLMADDNELILETLTDFLETRGCRTVATRSGFELLKRAPELHPDIILVDIQMPGMDGIETIRRLRAHSDPAIASLPIIAVTALAMTGDREKCLQAGANEYMSKPIALTQLVEQINKFLKAKRGEGQK